MSNKSPIALFIAATSAMTINTAKDISVKAEVQDLGGLKEWNTAMPVDAEFILDEKAQKIADEAAKNTDVCIPIGEGENCW